MPHIPKNTGIPLRKPDIYDNQNKKAWEQQRPQQERKNAEPYNTYYEQAQKKTKHIMERWESRPEHPKPLLTSHIIDLINVFPLHIKDQKSKDREEK